MPMTLLFRSRSFQEEEEEDCSPSSADAGQRWRRRRDPDQAQFPVVEVVLAALRKSLVTCSVEREDVASAMEIGPPTEVRHVSHVTFDRFNGFLGLPVELLPEIPKRVPSASVRVFGVSPQSMQCSIDERGNSVPTILLMMQKRLYAEGGLQAEGIFRITAENSQEECVRKQLNDGHVPRGIDVHCLAGLIKAWFRELPSGVLDSLGPDKVMRCDNEDEFARLVKQLPTTEAALLDWAINLMADVVYNERYNKMNVRNIAMVFAPNMTQMADPLTALIHAVQVMNLLKMLIEKTLRERTETDPINQDEPFTLLPSLNPVNAALSGHDASRETKAQTDDSRSKERKRNNLLKTVILDRMESFKSSEKRNSKGRSEDGEKARKSVTGRAAMEENGGGNDERLLDRLSLTKGVKKLCRHSVFQLSKAMKKNEELGV